MWDLETIKLRNRQVAMDAITDEQIAAWREKHSVPYFHDTDDEIRGYIADEDWDDGDYK